MIFRSPYIWTISQRRMEQRRRDQGPRQFKYSNVISLIIILKTFFSFLLQKEVKYPWDKEEFMKNKVQATGKFIFRQVFDLTPFLFSEKKNLQN